MKRARLSHITTNEKPLSEYQESATKTGVLGNLALAKTTHMPTTCKACTISSQCNLICHSHAKCTGTPEPRIFHAHHWFPIASLNYKLRIPGDTKLPTPVARVAPPSRVLAKELWLQIPGWVVGVEALGPPGEVGLRHLRITKVSRRRERHRARPCCELWSCGQVALLRGS